jgi:hypothetical protein
VPKDRIEHGISMLGAPTSGKTTFLAALSIALARDTREPHWNVVGADAASRQALVDLTVALHQRTFPVATPLAVESYRWLLVGKMLRTVRRRWVGVKRVMQTVRIDLDLADASGELSSPELSGNLARQDLVEKISGSRGIVFLFDPISEAKRGDAFKYLFNMLAELAERMVDTDDFAEGTLPHYVAVCISKFDDLKVLTTAEKLQMTVTEAEDRYGFPRVHEDYAQEFFLQLCRVLNAGDAELVKDTLERHFMKDRIKYFVSSAIGFYVDPATGEYDPDDIQNLIPNPADPDKPQIRGSIHPINVIEPLMWLAGKLTGEEML